MVNPHVRRLTVMLHADVISSTTLVQKDEALAHQRMQDAFHKFSTTIESYGGKTLELRGDALLAEFGRASDAVCAALAFQAANTQYNKMIDDDVRAELRVGLSLGEVIVADDTVTGAGVVLAQRLEQLANSGGVVIQGGIYEAVPTRFPFDYKSLGERELKGFDRPVKAFVVALRDGQSMPLPETQTNGTPSPGTTKSQAIELPDKPSIAVLPFENLSNDPEQDYFADGVAGDIITGLGRINQLFVIGRNTTFSYKGQTVDARTVARELGVRYVLEGSVRKAGSRVRVSTQLIDGASSSQLWAERYDRDLSDIFEVQDEITENVVGAIEPELTRAEWKRVATKRPEHLEAWDYVVRAVSLMMEFSEEASAQAATLLQQGVDVDPNYARTYGHKAWLSIWRGFQGWIPMDEALSSAVEDSSRGLQLDVNEPWCYIARAFIAIATLDSETCLASAKKAIELSPSFAYAHSVYALAIALSGHGKHALSEVDMAMRLSPRDVWREEFYLHYAMVYFQAGDYEAATLNAEKASLPRPGHATPYWMLMAALGQQGLMEKAQEALLRMKTNVPGFALTDQTIPRIYVLDADHSRLIDGLDKAGVLGV